MLHSTYHRPKWQFHILVVDYQDIAGKDVASGSGIRLFEQRTDKRIDALRKHYGIPDDQLPPDAWLWLDEFEEISAAAFAGDSASVRGRTTFARVLAEQSPHPDRPSLIERGYVKTRYIARRSKYARSAVVATQIYRYDHETRPFIIVEDYQGYYLDAEGELHCSIEEGYTDIVKQFFYCFEVVNLKIAAIDGSTPPALPRWQKQMSSGTEDALQPSFSRLDDTRQDTISAAVSGGNLKNSADDGVSNVEDTISSGNVSISASPERDNGPSQAALRVAPKTVETLLALLARHLAVPPKPDESDKAAMERYLTMWYEPALWMCHATDDLEPRRAWEVIERRVMGMLRGPTWYATRTTQGPITARNVVGPASSEKPLNGANWDIVWKELEKAGKWWPDAMTRYDGPPLQYAAGYAGVTQAKKPAAEPPIIMEPPEEIVPPTVVAWMTRELAVALCNEICDAYPTLRPNLTPKDSLRTRWYASLQWGPEEDAWFDLENTLAWRSPSEQTQYALRLALAYAAQRNAIPTEVGVVEEPPPIILEAAPGDAAPPENEQVYVSMDVIEEQLQHGLHPRASSPVVEVVPVVAESPPALPGKTGMTLWIAEQLLDRIVDAGYSAQLRPISDDRAVLSVEVSPGTWIDVDSSAAWQRHLKSVAQSPPGSVAAVISAVAQLCNKQTMEARL